VTREYSNALPQQRIHAINVTTCSGQMKGLLLNVAGGKN
jgi:hypothetical protein